MNRVIGSSGSLPESSHSYIILDGDDVAAATSSSLERLKAEGTSTEPPIYGLSPAHVKFFGCHTISDSSYAPLLGTGFSKKSL